VLGSRFINEANGILRNIFAELDGSRTENSRRTVGEMKGSITHLEAVNLFLPASILERLRSATNRGLRARKKTAVSLHELQGIITLHVLCASYGESPSTVCSSLGKGFFLADGDQCQAIFRCMVRNLR